MIMFINPPSPQQQQNQQLSQLNQQFIKLQNSGGCEIKHVNQIDDIQKIGRLTLVKFQPTSLPRGLAQIGFPNLIYLQLHYNQLESIQLLSMIHAPKLSFLGIDNNHITKIKAFSRTNFPQLTNIQIMNNPITQLTIQRIRIKAQSQAIKQKQFFFLMYVTQESNQNHLIGQNLFQLLRLEPNSKKYIHVQRTIGNSSKRIYQPQFHRIVKDLNLFRKSN